MRFALPCLFAGMACFFGAGAGCVLTSDLDALSAGGGGSSSAGAAGGMGGAGVVGGSGGEPDGGAGGSGGLECPTGQKPCDGACVSIDQPSTGCAAESCDPCAIDNAVTACFEGACAASACLLGFKDCNADLSDGCEAELGVDEDNCGACGAACTFLHADAACVGGICTMGQCEAGFDDCDTSSDTGCEVNVDNDPKRCGDCTNICPDMGATATCTAGQCGISGCAAPMAECLGVLGDCETNTDTSVDHCGFCNNPCGFSEGIANCIGGMCALVGCAGTFGNCDGNDFNGCETDLDVSDKNCGACGRDCLGGACVGGVCQPVELATGQLRPTGLAADGTHVYWVTDDAVRKVAFGAPGSVPITLAASASGLGGYVVLDNTYVYWSVPNASGSVHRVVKGGGVGELLATGFSQPYYLELVGGSTLLFAAYGGQAGISGIFSMPKDGSSAPVMLAPAMGASGLATLGATIFYTDYDTDEVLQYELGTVTTLATGQDEPWQIRTDGVDLYWTNYAAAEVAKMPIGGGPVTVLASGQTGASDLALDATHVYWTNAIGAQVARVPKAGGTVEVLATLQINALGIAVDSQRVFWSTRVANGTIMMLAK